jgi:DNA polymerase III psi subunit
MKSSNRKRFRNCRDGERKLRLETLEDRIVLSAAPILDDASVVATSYSFADQAADQSEQQFVQSLQYWQFNLLTTSNVVYLTPTQVATIPNTFEFQKISQDVRDLFSIDQIQALRTGPVRISVLNATQISWLSTSQIQSLEWFDYPYLSPAQIPQLSTAQIAVLNDPGPFADWTPAARAALTQPQVQALRVGAVRIDKLTPLQLTWLTTPQIQSLQMWDFKFLSPAQIPLLTPQQIAEIPDPGPFADWTPAARAALTLPQIQALRVGTVWIDKLTSQQISWLTSGQIQSLQVFDFKRLSPAQVPLLTPAQISELPDPGPFAEWTSAARAALTLPQVQALRVGAVRIDKLTTQQIAWLTTPQIQALQMWDFKFLSPAQIPLLTPQQIAGIPDPGPFAEWSSAAQAALTQPQVQALRVDLVRIDKLSPQQIAWLTAAQIQSLQMWDFKFLSPAQIPVLTPQQIAEIPDPGPLAEWSAAAQAALTQPQVQALRVDLVRIDKLSLQQISWLTAEQVQSLQAFDFKFLNPFQIPLLTTSQVSQIETPGALAALSLAARSRLTLPQVRALDVAATGLALLPAAQTGYLVRGQIQSLSLSDFQFLSELQTPLLTPAQIATIPDPGPFVAWTPAARAALTLPQIQALRVATVRIDRLTPEQVGWLTPEQVQSLQRWDFKYLNDEQIPLLTTQQIQDIPDPGILSEWRSSAVAALTTSQVQALRVATVRISLLTLQQIHWLTPQQIASLQLADFQYLTASEAPYLTTLQIASIPDPGPIATWSPATYAALSKPQVQALRVATIRLTWLTDSQVAWLTESQVQSLVEGDLDRLNPAQIPWVTEDQLGSLLAADALLNMTEASQRALSRAQLLALPLKIWGKFVRSAYPENYEPFVTLQPGADGLPTNAHRAAEAKALFDLVPYSSVTDWTIADGDWSDPLIWNRRQVPDAGANVLISAGTSVRFDAVMTSAVRTLRIDGRLDFARDADTTLRADTIVVFTTGQLHIGTQAAPIPSNVKARVVIANNAPIDATWDPTLISRGLISRGSVTMVGQAVTAYATLASPALRGATSLRLSQSASYWKAGDTILVTGTNQYVADAQTEQRVIRAVYGEYVVVDALSYDHIPPANSDAGIYVANISRNVIFEPENPSAPISQMPHMMFMHNPDVYLENIRVTDFGRTDKSVPLNSPVVVNGVLVPGTGTNPRGRYSIHFHHTGIDPDVAPAIVRNSVVVDNPGWGFVNHSSNVRMENNVSYRSYGSAFTTEDGNEIGEMIGNLAIYTRGTGAHIQSRETTHDFAHGGHGFWLQGPGVALSHNVSVASADSAFVYFTVSSKNLFDAVNLENPALAEGHLAVPVGTVPLRSFTHNVAVAARSGLEIWFHQAVTPGDGSVIEDFTFVNARYNGIDLHYVGNLTIRDSHLRGDLTLNVYSGIATNHFSHDLVFENLRIEGFETGIVAAQRRTTVVLGGDFSVVRGVLVGGAADGSRLVYIDGNQTFRQLNSTQLAGRTQYDVFLTAVGYDFAHQPLAALLASSRVYYRLPSGSLVRLYFPEQRADYVPFPTATSLGFVPANYLDLTNQQLRTRYGVSLAGALPPGLTMPYADILAFVNQLH